MERLGPQKPNDFSLLASPSFRMAGKEGTVEGLRSALQVDPANVRVTAYLGRCLANDALYGGTDRDEARRA